MKTHKRLLRVWFLLMGILLCGGILSGCIPADASQPNEEDIELIQLEPPKEGQDIAIFETNWGTIKMMLFPEETPQTVAHFKTLIESGFYDGRAIAKVDQTTRTIYTGIDETTDTHGRVMTEDGKDVPIEISPNLWHFSGAVSAYQNVTGFNSKYTNSDSRFFIVGTKEPFDQTEFQLEEQEFPKVVRDAYKEHGGLLEYSSCFTVFAQVYEGLDVVDDIIDHVKLKEDSVEPTEELYIIKATLSTYSSEN